MKIFAFVYPNALGYYFEHVLSNPQNPFSLLLSRLPRKCYEQGKKEGLPREWKTRWQTT